MIQHICMLMWSSNGPEYGCADIHTDYFEEDLYLSALPAVRISLLLTYLRIFAGDRFRKVVFVVIGFNVAYAIAFVLISVFQCEPINLVSALTNRCLCSQDLHSIGVALLGWRTRRPMQ
jgi:hypothetical protein